MIENHILITSQQGIFKQILAPYCKRVKHGICVHKIGCNVIELNMHSITARKRYFKTKWLLTLCIVQKQQIKHLILRTSVFSVLYIFVNIDMMWAEGGLEFYPFLYSSCFDAFHTGFIKKFKSNNLNFWPFIIEEKCFWVV